MVSSTPPVPAAWAATGGQLTPMIDLEQRPRLAAVDINAGPRDQRCLRRGQKDHDRRHFLRTPKAAEGKICFQKARDLLWSLLLATLPYSPWEHDRSGGNRVHQDMIFGQLAGERFREADHRGFRGVIGRGTTPLSSIDRRDMDDSSTPLAPHLGDGQP